MLPFTAGARPGNRNMIFLPNSANSRLLPERKPSPTPTSKSKDPTPQAIPNMVRNERSLCAHRLRKICAKMSKTVRMFDKHCTFFDVSGAVVEVGIALSENCQHTPPDLVTSPKDRAVLAGRLHDIHEPGALDLCRPSHLTCHAKGALALL